MDKILKIISGVGGGFIGFLWGDMDGFLICMLVFMAIDYITGVASAYRTKTLDSQIAFSGFLKKIMLLLIVVMANLLDILILKRPGSLRTIVLFYYIGNDGISILENAAKMGIPIPKRLKDALTQLKENEESN